MRGHLRPLFFRRTIMIEDVCYYCQAQEYCKGNKCAVKNNQKRKWEEYLKHVDDGCLGCNYTYEPQTGIELVFE